MRCLRVFLRREAIWRIPFSGFLRLMGKHPWFDPVEVLHGHLVEREGRESINNLWRCWKKWPRPWKPLPWPIRAKARRPKGLRWCPTWLICGLRSMWPPASGNPWWRYIPRIQPNAKRWSGSFRRLRGPINLLVRPSMWPCRKHRILRK